MTVRLAHNTQSSHGTMLRRAQQEQSTCTSYGLHGPVTSNKLSVKMRPTSRRSANSCIRDPAAVMMRVQPVHPTDLPDEEANSEINNDH